MVRAGFSPSVRLFEAAACGTPILTDQWPGLNTFFTPDEEILVVQSAAEVLEIVRELPEDIAHKIGARARDRVLSEHTAFHRALELESFIAAARESAMTTPQIPGMDFQRAEVAL